MRPFPMIFFLAAGTSLTAPFAPPAGARPLPVCDGKHKRPANPYGSVLLEGLKPAAAAEPRSSAARPDAAKPEAAALPAAKPQVVSRATWRASLGPCGIDRG